MSPGLYVKKPGPILHLVTVTLTFIFAVRCSLSRFPLQNDDFPVVFEEKYFEATQIFHFSLNFYPLILTSVGAPCLQQLLLRFCRGDLKVSSQPAILHVLIEILLEGRVARFPTLTYLLKHFIFLIFF